jgi:hypothetical protein
VNVPQGDGVQLQLTPELLLSFVTVAPIVALLLISRVLGGAGVIVIAIGLLLLQAERNVATAHATAIRRALRFIVHLP